MVVDHLEVLKRTVLLKNGIHMPDEQHALATLSRFRTPMFGDQSTGALNLIHRHPAHFETKRLKAGHQNLSDFAQAFKIFRSAVDLDQLAEQINRLLFVPIDDLNHLQFGGGEVGNLRLRDKWKEKRDDEQMNWFHAANNIRPISRSVHSFRSQVSLTRSAPNARCGSSFTSLNPASR